MRGEVVPAARTQTQGTRRRLRRRRAPKIDFKHLVGPLEVDRLIFGTPQWMCVQLMMILMVVEVEEDQDLHRRGGRNRHGSELLVVS